MTDNSFRELGQLPPDLTLGATSEQIIRRGRRIKTIRQTSIVVAAAVALLGITSIVALAGGGHHDAQTVQTGSGNGLGIALAPPSSPSPAPAASTSSAPVVAWSAPASSAPASSRSGTRPPRHLPSRLHRRAHRRPSRVHPLRSRPRVPHPRTPTATRRLGEPWRRAVATPVREGPCAVGIPPQ